MASFLETVRRVTLEPAGFFNRVTGEVRPWPAIAFAILCGLVSAIPGISVELLVPVDFGPFGGLFSGMPEVAPARLGGGALVAGLLVGLVLAPVLLLLGLYVGALTYQALIRLIVGRENAGYWARFKIYAYTSVVGLLAWIPVLGLLASLYGYYLVFVGVREAHSATPARAAAMATVPLLVFAGSLVIGIVSVSA